MAVTDPISAASAQTVLKPYVETDRMEILRVVLTGLLVGAIVPLIGILIANWVITPIFCHPSDKFVICASGGIVAYHSAAIIVGLAVIALFANWGVFRPLPLVLAATISMWGFKKFVDTLSSSSLFEYLVFSMALTMLCYLLFYWLLRLRNFPASILLTIVTTVIVCLAVVG